MALIQEFERYAHDTAGLDISPSRETRSIPPFLRERYDLYRVTIDGREITVLVLRDPDHFTPAAFEKQLNHFPDDVQRDYVVVADALPGFLRKRLIERNIPFVVPGVQLHWPDLGVAVRARRGRSPWKFKSYIHPPAHVLIVGQLGGTIPNGISAQDAAHRLGYSPMTMTRAFDELEGADLARTKRRGHERQVHFQEDHKALWIAARPKMRSPVLKTERLPRTDADQRNLLAAGESALSAMSMLASPAIPVYAIDRKQWTTRATKPETPTVPDEAICDLQVWSYDPRLTASEQHVDPFSLTLSLQDTADERVALALEEMIEDYKW